MRMMIVVFVLGIIMIAASAFAADTYEIDPLHSTLGFSAAHLMVSQVTGQFDQYEGTIVYDAHNLAHSHISVTIQAASINTRAPQRDEHLRAADFFDAQQFPAITFISKNITPDLITGDLTIKGITKEVSIHGAILGPIKAPWGSIVIGFAGSFKLNRQDYGIKWNQMLEQGGVVVGDEVIVNINVEAKKK